MSAIDQAISLLRARRARVHVIATGAGAGVQQKLWDPPGASQYFAGASFPYATEQTEQLLGFRPTRFVSEATAIDLACAAYLRAYDPARPDLLPVGIGVTASVASVQSHRGDHRAVAACITRAGAIANTLVLEKGAGAETRARDSAMVDDLAIDAIRAALDGTDSNVWADVTALARSRLLERPCFSPTGLRATGPQAGAPLFPGAFDPPHEGHFGIADAVRRLEGLEAVFTVCTTPPHKPALGVPQMLERVRELPARWLLFTEGDPLYVDKARRFPGRPIVLGVDAFLRMLDPKWGCAPDELLDELERLGTRLLVFGRTVDGIFVDPRSAIGSRTRVAVPVEGRWDVTSSDLRSRRAEGYAPPV